jgi:CYTH domain-containing protein
MADEIERKWLVDRISFDLKNYEKEEISQGYLRVMDSENDECRVRKKGDKCFLTIKKGEGVKREESEVEIHISMYREFWILTSGRRIRKTRFSIPDKGYVIELDSYSGKLEKLMTAEVEFGSVAESQRYVPPEWFGREVTGDSRYSNKNLALYGLPKGV